METTDPICAGDCGRPIRGGDSRVIVDGEPWHYGCLPLRTRLGLDVDCAPPIGRERRRVAPQVPVSMDPSAIRRLRRR